MNKQPPPSRGERPAQGQSAVIGSQASRIYLLPNLMTAGNLFCGFLAIVRCIQARFNVILDETQIDPTKLYTEAVLLILLAMVFDALDGRLARLGGRESLFGKEFDSIADTVSFGVAPALMTLFLILNPEESLLFRKIGWFVSFVYLLSVGVRLARFNVVTHPLVYPANFDRSEKDFIGLPAPAAAGVISTIALLVARHDLQEWAVALPFLMLLISYLMVSAVRYPSFKGIDWQTKIRFRHFVLLLAVAGFLYLYRHHAVVILFLAYLFYGIVQRALRWRRRRGRGRGAGRARAASGKPGE